MALLGPLRAEGDDGTPIDIGGARLRMLLSRLALDAGRAVPVEALIDGLWGAEPPADAANALQSLVSRLRRVLRPAGVELESGSGGYRLAVPPEAVDLHQFERLSAKGRRELSAGRDSAAAESLSAALALWRGAALSDVLDAPFAAAPATLLDERRTETSEDWFEAEIRLGRHSEVLAELTAAAQAHPLRERLAGLRIRALAAAGRQAEALAAYTAIRATLADELGVDPSAELQEVHLRALRGEYPRVAVRVDRLPQRLTSFIGRTDELKLLDELLEGARLVTLVGPGGAGKTRLSTEVASRHPAHAAGRVWFVPLAGVREAGDVVSALLTALEVRDVRVTDTEARRRLIDPIEHVVEALSGAEALLVLDNCEHLVDTAAALAEELLRRLPSVRVLATSREPLAITGEALCPLGPLPVPDETAPPADVATLDSVRLFLDRAVAVRPGFRLDESTVDAVRQICRRLDGMPLALELAAARLRSMTAGQIAERLDDRFRLLTSGSRTALPRQRTLRAVVEWSWDLLTEDEIRLARRLSVFAASFSEEAVENVCADEELPARDVVYVLGSLVEKSIVDAVDAVGGRYRLLETLRVYAAERLAESGEADRLRAAMVKYYAELAERNESLLRGRDQLDAIDVYEQESDNFTAGLRTAIETGDPQSAARLLFGLFWYWNIVGQNERVAAFVDEVLEFDDRLRPDLAASLRLCQVLVRTTSGANDRANVRELLEECVRTGAVDGNPWLWVGMPIVAYINGEKELAKREVRRAVERDDVWGRAAGRWAESFILGDCGDLDGAERARELAYQGFAEVGDRWGMGMTHGFRAAALSQAGEHEAAIEGYTEGLRLMMELRSRDDVVQQWWRLAMERSRAGDQDGAWRELEAAEQYAAAGSRGLRMIIMMGRSELLIRQNRIAEARTVHEELARMPPAWPAPEGFEAELIAIVEATLLLAEGRPDAAEPKVFTVIEAAANRADMPDLAGVVELMAQIRHRQGSPESAVRLLALSAVARGRMDLGSPEVRALIGALTEELGAQRYADLLAEASRTSRAELIDAVRAERSNP